MYQSKDPYTMFKEADSLYQPKRTSPSSTGRAVKNVGGGALIGGIVLGPVGAVIGGLTGLAKNSNDNKK